MYLRPGDGIGIRVGLRSQILGVRVSSGAPSLVLIVKQGMRICKLSGEEKDRGLTLLLLRLKRETIDNSGRRLENAPYLCELV